MAKRKSKFRDQVRSDNERQEERQYGYLSLPEGVSLFKEKPNTRVNLDILPYEVTEEKHPDRDDEEERAAPGTLWYKRPYRMHRNIGEDNDAVVCPSSVGKRCPICEYRNKRIGEKASKEETDALKAARRVLYVVVPRDHADFEEKPHIWDIAHGNFQKQLKEDSGEDETYLDFPDLELGMTLRIRFVKETFAGNPFAKATRIDFIPREPYDEGILDEVPALDDVLIILPAKDLEAKFFEIDEEEQDIHPPEEEETTRKRTRTRTHEAPEDNKREEKKERPKDKCPHGHGFGVDCDKHDECGTCDLWEDCIEEQDRRGEQ